jgi:hypothetical protein
MTNYKDNTKRVNHTQTHTRRITSLKHAKSKIDYLNLFTGTLFGTDFDFR